jgi:hypothetical protein
VLFALLLILYPLALILFTAIIVLLTGKVYLWLLIIVLPFCAWCYKEYAA